MGSLFWRRVAIAFEIALPVLERAIGLNPNSALAHQMIGFVQIWLGRPDVAIDHFLYARRLNPIDILSFTTSLGLASAQFLAGRNQEALVSAERALTDNPKHLPLLRQCAAIFASCGQMEKAQEITRQLLQLSPNERISSMTRFRLFRRPKDAERQIAALRAAGLPE